MPKEIIVGDKMSFKDEYTLLSIAKAHHIKVYKIKRCYKNGMNSLLKLEYDEESINLFLEKGAYSFPMLKF